MTDTLNPLLVRRQMQVPVLRPLFRRGEDLSVHRAPSVLGHHHSLREQRQLPLRIPVHPVSHAFARTLAPRDPDVLASISSQRSAQHGIPVPRGRPEEQERV